MKCLCEQQLIFGIVSRVLKYNIFNTIYAQDRIFVRVIMTFFSRHVEQTITVRLFVWAEKIKKLLNKSKSKY